MMANTSGYKTARRRPARLGPAFDRLDARLVLSASPAGLLPSTPLVEVAPPTSPLSIVLTSPASSAVLDASPTTLFVTFDRPVDDFSLSSRDFDLMHVAPDGSTSPLGPGEATLVESLDTTGRRIALAVEGGLVPGGYQLQLDPTSQLQGLDGSDLSSTAFARPIDDFTVAQPQQGMTAAPDLGTVRTSVMTVSGNLDLASDPAAVQYERFELAPGHHWQVDLAVSALGVGGSFDSTVSLFNTQGRLIATSSEGPAGDLDDPSLTQGLDPGTYYVGISAKKNVPTALGDYHPQDSAIASAGPGGPFLLGLGASVADQSTALLGLQLDHADPLSSSPTGLTLQFSGPLDPRSFEVQGQDSVMLVDQSGHDDPLIPTSSDAGAGQLTLSFGQALAPGLYRVVLAGPSGLVDLSGREPVAPGMPPGTLGSFVVASSSPVAGDLGVIFPDLAASRVGGSISVSPGHPVSEGFAVVQSGFFAFEGVSPASGVRYVVEDGSGRVLATGPGSSPVGTQILMLQPGAYHVVVSAGDGAANLAVTIRQVSGGASSLLDGGVSQAPAVGLRLATSPATLGQSAGASASNPSTMLAQGSTPGVGPATPTGPSAVMTYSGVGMAGSSSNANMAGASTNPGYMGGGGAGDDGLPGGRKASPIEIRRGSSPSARPDILPPEAATDAQGAGGNLTLDGGLLGRSAGSRREDDRSLADADRAGQVLAEALGWLEGPSAGGVVEAPGPDAAGLNPAPAIAEGARVESASLASPLGLGVVLGAIAYGCRRKLWAFWPASSKAGAEVKGSHPHVMHHHLKARARSRVH